MDNEVVSHAATAIGGGALASVAAWWRDRKRTPAEIDSIIAKGAEMNVQSALAIAAAESKRADKEAARADALAKRLDAALARVDQLQAALDAVREELNDIKNNGV